MFYKTLWRFLSYALFALLVLTGSSVSALALTIQNVSQSASSVPVYGKLEVRFELDQSYANPYDPDIVDASFTFTGPSGTPRTIPAFWHGTLPGFMARIVPVETGAHIGVLRVRDHLGGFDTDTVNFTGTAGTAPGFIRMDSRDARFLRFDSGRPFTPMGHNLCWGGADPGFYTFLDRMEDAGENWTRFWMVARQSQSIEWGDNLPPAFRGLGNYDPQRCVLWDDMVEGARARGIYVQMCLDSFHGWNEHLQGNWHENPYNTDNGGMVEWPIQYFTNAQAIKLAKQRYRYIVARWGYSPNTLCWELWNEVDAVGHGDPVQYLYENNVNSVVNWHRDMARYIRSIDPYDHLITTSFADRKATQYYDPMWQLPEMEIVQPHRYSPPSQVPFEQMALIEERMFYGKPNLLGEGPLESPDSNDGIRIHDMIWPAALRGSGAMSWEWGWFHDNNLYNYFPPLVAFMDGEDWAAEQLQGAEVEVFNNPGAFLALYGSEGPRSAYLWVYTFSSVPAVSLRFDTLQPGDYVVEFWDTYTGTIYQTNNLTADSGGLTVDVPAGRRDIAIKVKSASIARATWSVY